MTYLASIDSSTGIFMAESLLSPDCAFRPCEVLALTSPFVLLATPSSLCPYQWQLFRPLTFQLTFFQQFAYGICNVLTRFCLSDPCICLPLLFHFPSIFETFSTFLVLIVTVGMPLWPAQEHDVAHYPNFFLSSGLRSWMGLVHSRSGAHPN